MDSLQGGGEYVKPERLSIQPSVRMNRVDKIEFRGLSKPNPRAPERE